MYIETNAKTILSGGKGNPDPWFGTLYTMNLYRGCEHQCIYCDSRSECYRIENFADVLVKTNAIEVLRKELYSKKRVGTIGTGAMSDPYTPAEQKYHLTRQALKFIADFHFPLHLLTKSDRVVDDLEVIKQISSIYACVNFTITTTDDALASKIEPGAPRPSARLKTMRAFAQKGIYTGITVMPMLPFLEDSDQAVEDIFIKAKEHGAQFVLFSTGMTLRDRQRSYYYHKLQQLFPGLAERYNHTYGNQYSCQSPRANKLHHLAQTLSKKLHLPLSVIPFKPTNIQSSFLSA